jgi:hypothetical protein
MDYTKYIQSINDDVNNQNNQKLLSSNSNYYIEKHISHHNYDDKTKQNVLSKLKNIIDSTTAMKVFNYLVSNNLIDEFLASYDYLTTLRIYNPLTYTQIINYVIDYKKTNTEMDDILEEEINFLLDTRVSKKSLQSLRKRTNNPNSVRVLNKIIRNVPDKQSVKNMSSAKKELLIETLEQLPTQDDFEEKEDEEENQMQDLANADAANEEEGEEEGEDEAKEKATGEKVRKIYPKYEEKGTEMERVFLQSQRRKAAEAEESEEEEETDEEYRLRMHAIRLKEPFMGISYERREELKAEYAKAEEAKADKKRKLEGEIEETEEEIEINKKKEKTKRTKKEMKETDLMGSQDKPEPPKRKYTKKLKEQKV